MFAVEHVWTRRMGAFSQVEYPCPNYVRFIWPRVDRDPMRTCPESNIEREREMGGKETEKR